MNDNGKSYVLNQTTWSPMTLTGHVITSAIVSFLRANVSKNDAHIA